MGAAGSTHGAFQRAIAHAAVRWIARLAAEKDVTIEDVELAASALCKLRASPERVEARATFLHLARRPRRAA